MRTIIFMFCLFFFATIVNAQKEYRLINKLDSADFNYGSLYSIDTFPGRRKAFLPVKGSFTVFTFIATYKGLSHLDGKEHEFHDILIIKTDKDNLIEDAFQYTLEWTEMPIPFGLYKSKSMGVVLSDELSVKKLNLYKVQEADNSSKESREAGVIKMN